MYQSKRWMLTTLTVCLLLSGGHGQTAAQNPEAQALELGKPPIERELAGEQTHNYLIELAAGDLLHVIVEQRGVDVVVTVFAPDGKKLKEVDSPNGTQGPEPVLLIAETAGAYRLEVRSLEKGAAGKYAVTLTEKRAATAQDRAQLAKQALLDEAHELVIQADSLRRQGRYKDALPLIQRALAIQEKVLGPEHPEVSQSLDIMGRIYRATEDYTRAEPLFQRALAIDKKAFGEEHPAVATDLNSLAVLYQDTGDYARAEPLFQKSLAILEKTLGPEHRFVAAALNDLGGLYFDTGDYARVEPLYQRALAIREKVRGTEHFDVAQSLNNLALLYKNMGDPVRAAPLLQRALAIYEKAWGKEHPDVALALNNLAQLYRDTGDPVRAEPLYQRALAIYEKTFGPEHLLVAAILNNLASLYGATGDPSRAAALFQRALTIQEKILGQEHPLVAQSLNNLAGPYSALNDYARAVSATQRALAIWEKTLGKEHPSVSAALNNLAQLYRDQSDYASATPLYQRSLAIKEKALGKEHPLVALLLNNLATLYQLTGDDTQAVAFYQRANEIQETNLTALLSAGSQQQKQLYLNTLAGDAAVTVSFHVQHSPQNNAAARLSLTTILRRKGRALDAFTGQLEALRRRANLDDKKLLDDLAAVQSQLANLQLGGGRLKAEARRAEVARLTAEQERLEDAISRRSAEFRAAAQPITLERVQAAVPASAALVELFVYKPFNAKAKGAEQRLGAARYVAYVVRQKDAVPQFVDLGEAAPIDAAAAQFRNALKSPKTPKRQVRRLARDLDARLMQPIRKLLGNTKRVLLAPDGALNLIPFEALVDENGRYLIENYSFNYLTSGRDLLRLQITSYNETGAAIVANPQFDLTKPVVKCGTAQRGFGLVPDTPDAQVEYRGTDFTKLCYATLAGTAQEAANLGPLLRDAKMWTRQEATEAALKSLHRPRVLHIATHGFFFPDQKAALPEGDKPRGTSDTLATSGENPLLRSGLILAGVNQRQSGPDNDGVLTALEAAGLDLFGTKLVVLSACETGLGDAQNGQGVYGLRRALVLAGSETQIMSLWKVSDTATRFLMVAYYRRVQRGAGRVEALRAVQLGMLRGPVSLVAAPGGRKRGTADTIEEAADTKDYRHPYYWAAFIPSGDWRGM